MHAVQGRSGIHFSPIQKSTEAPAQKQQLKKESARPQRAGRSTRASVAEKPEQDVVKQPEEEERSLPKRARRSAQSDVLLQTAAAKPDQEQQPAARKGKRVAGTATASKESSEPDGKRQLAAKRRKHASPAEAPQDRPEEHEEAVARPSRVGKLASSFKAGSEANQPTQSCTAKAGKQAAAKPAQQGPESEGLGPLAAGGRHAARLGGQTSHARAQDRQLRATALRCALA